MGEQSTKMGSLNNTNLGRVLFWLQEGAKGLFKYYDTNAPAHFISAETNFVC